MKKRLLFIIILICSLSCQKYANNPDLKIARDFMDAYYVFADQQKALPMTIGLAKEKLEKEIELLKDVSDHQDAYRSRDILFDLKKEVTNKDEAIYLFELTIKIPKLEDRKEMVNISIDRKAGKVKYFGVLR